jgi:polar amino acid transport system substrate-binding protein
MIKKIILIPIISIIVILNGCGSGSDISFIGKKEYKIGIDPVFYPNNFGKENPNILGFIEEILLRISKEMNIEFEKMSTNWDILFENLDNNKLDVVVSSKQPYNFNMAKYDFSNVFLNTGPVLLIRKDSKLKKIKDLKGKMIAIEDSDIQLLARKRFPEVTLIKYSSIPRALEAVDDEEVNGAIVNIIPVSSYMHQTFNNRFKILEILTDQGLKFVSKNENKYLIELLDRGLRKIGEKELNQMKIKWNLM